MNKKIVTGLSAVIVGLGVFASAGSAYAAGCLQPNQTGYALTEDTDASDDAYALNAKGFSCDVGQAQTGVLTQRQVTPASTPSLNVPNETGATFATLAPGVDHDD